VNFRLFTKKYEKLFATYKKEKGIELSLGNLYFGAGGCQELGTMIFFACKGGFSFSHPQR
jgi:hypothetical protein